MKTYIKQIKALLAEHHPNYGYYNANSLLDMLYNCYTRYNPIDSTAIREDFSKLNDLLQHLSLKQNDAITDIVCSLCSKHEHLAFVQGLLVGVRLLSELEQQ